MPTILVEPRSTESLGQAMIELLYNKDYIIWLRVIK